MIAARTSSERPLPCASPEYHGASSRCRYGQSKSCIQTRTPWRLGRIVAREPVRRGDPRAAVGAAPPGGPRIEPREAVLRDRDRVVLPADVAAIVEQRDAVRIEGSPVARLPGKSHEVAGPPSNAASFISGRSYQNDSGPDAPVRVDAQHAREIRDTRARVPRRSGERDCGSGDFDNFFERNG